MPVLGSTSSQSGRVPGSPTITGVTAGNAQVTVAFNAPAYTGKSSVTYTATSSPGSFTASGSSSPLVVTGLTNGTSYTFTVRANGSSGVNSAASSASSSVSPVVPVTPNVEYVVVAGGGGGGSGGNDLQGGAGGGGVRKIEVDVKLNGRELQNYIVKDTKIAK